MQTITRSCHTFTQLLSYTLLTMLLRFLALVFAAVLGTSSVLAQDTRTVTEPHYPTPCKILYAQLSPHNGTLPEETIERHYRDNERIESAMDACPSGQSVILHSSKNGRNVFLIGPLRLHAGVTLVVDVSAALWGSRDPRNYDVQPGSCGIVGNRGAGCLPLILAEDAPHSGLMGGGVLDGRGGAKLLGGTETWWELSHRAKVESASQATARLLVVRRSNDFTLYQITLRNSPSGHVTTESTDGFTAWGLRIDTPQWARNTDGIDFLSGSSNLSVVDSDLRSGDDNLSPKASAAGSVTHLTVRNTHLYNGHGFAIGSQTSGGISAVRVDTLSIDGSENGLRIKSDRSRGGLVRDVRFENVCMRAVGNPIVFTSTYTPLEGASLPVYRDILLHNVHSLAPGGLTLDGLDAAHRLEASFDNVVIDNVRSSDITARHALLQLKHGNLDPTGEDVHLTGSDGGGAPYPCANAFLPFPVNTVSPVSAELIPPADNTFYVAADGTGDYTSIQAALNHVPAAGGLILVAPGTYRERIFVRPSHVTLKSANPDPRKTVIVFDLSHGTKGPDQGSSATVRVQGDDFTAENITFQNDFNMTHRQEEQGSYAPALALRGDRNLLHNVRLLGNQGTLRISAKNCPQSSGAACEQTRTYLSQCFIGGNVGFISGDGTAFFDGCEIHSTPHSPDGFITAQGKHENQQQSLFVFRNCRFTADPGVSNVQLGRPMRDLAEVIFLNPQLGPQITSTAWREWEPGVTHRLETAYLRLYQPTGPGAPTTSLTLTSREAARYTPRDVLAGKDKWNPSQTK